MSQSEPISLLWPAEEEDDHTAHAILPPQVILDLELEETINGFDPDRTLRQDVRSVLTDLPLDPAIIEYRQAILKDMIALPSIQTLFETVLPLIYTIAQYQRGVDRQRSALQQLAWRASELENLVEIVNALTTGLNPEKVSYQSAGLNRLYQMARGVAGDPTFQQLEKELPEILPKLRATVSITIGVNLDRRLRPIEAVLLAVNDEKFEDARFLDRLLGRDQAGGIAPIHRVPQQLYDIPKNSELGRRGADPLMVPLFKDLADVLEKTVRPIDDALKRYVALNTQFLTRLRPELGFFTAACRFYNKLRDQKLPLTFPEVAPADERVCHFEEGYNLNLVRHLLTAHPGLNIGDRVVKNDCFMTTKWGRIFILTGPNRGGKTTYTQMVGLIQLFAQAGLFVPAQSARLSPVDGIFTHFPTPEKLERATGRFGDEAQRLAAIFKEATSHSLVLLNETLTGTTPGESLYLAQDIVKIFRRLGLRAIYNTHLHALAEGVEELNHAVSGQSKIVSVVASRIEPQANGETGQRTFKIEAGPPLGRSYALEIAASYGIRYDQLQAMLRDRGVLPEN